MDEVKLTTQHQITIPKRICEQLNLQGGDRFEVSVLSGFKIVLKPKKLIDADDPAYRLGQDILEAEKQIQSGDVADWDDVKREHEL